jgi:YHS domain-containing protein
MKKQIVILSVTAILFIHCNSNNSNSAKEVKKDTTPVAMQKLSAKELFKGIQFDNKTDYSCGMPVSAGVADTAHYKGKVYGFCSAECKAEFLSKPEEYLSKK